MLETARSRHSRRQVGNSASSASEAAHEGTGQERSGTRHLAGGHAEVPKLGPNDVLIKIAQDRDLRHRHAHLQLGCLGAEDDPGADGRRPRILRRDRRHRQRSARASPSATASRARATSPAGIAATAARAAGTCAATPSGRRRQPPGLLRRVPGASRPSTRSSCRTRITDDIASILDPLGNATHTALAFNMVGEDVLITGAGPDRHHGGRHRALHRRAPRRHHRRQRLPARPRAQDGRDARPQRDEREARRRDAASSACRKASTSASRCRAMPPRSATCCARCTTAAASRCSAFRPARSPSTGTR